METSKRETNRWVYLAARLLAGGIFLTLGLSKAGNPLLFAKEIHTYGILPAEPQFFLNLTALLLPWAEIVCGFMLIIGLSIECSSLTLALLTLVFTGAIFHRTLGIYFSENISFWAIHFNCGCGTGDVVSWEKLLSNTALIFICLWIFFARSRHFALQYFLNKRSIKKADTAS
jgi:uncharacterized membrane protein YphA (DoxX/SURF4 family)